MVANSQNNKNAKVLECLGNEMKEKRQKYYRWWQMTRGSFSPAQGL